MTLRFSTPHRNLIKCLPLFLALSTFFSADAQEKYLSEKNEILELREQSNLAIKNHLVVGIIDILTDDVNIVASNRQVFSGKKAFENAWTNLFAENPDLYFIRESKEISLSLDGNTAWEQGNWKALRVMDSDWKSYGGSYSALWIQVEGNWKIKSQLFVKLY